MVTQKCVFGQSSLRSRFLSLKSALMGRKSNFQPQQEVSDRNIFSELSDSQTAVWCQLSPGIDPDQWAFICRCLGSLTPQEFSEISRRLQMSHEGVKKALKEHVRGLLGLNMPPNPSDIPIVSTGPSGIGGEFQREI